MTLPTMRATAIEQMDDFAAKAAVAQSRMWLLKRWETSDPRLLHMKLLRHAERLEGHA